MSRRYDRSSRYGGTRWRWLGAVAALALVATMVAPAASYTSGELDRSVDANVVDDPNGVVANVEQSPEYGEVDTFTTISNNYGEPIDVTIRLEGLSASFANIDDDGTPDERTITLAPGSSVVVEVCADRFWAIFDPNIRFQFEWQGPTVSGTTEAQRFVALENDRESDGCAI